MPEQNSNITVTEGKRKNNVCVINIKNNSSEGFRISLQSDHSFKFLGEDSGRTFKLAGNDCWLPRQGNNSNVPGVPGYFSVEKNSFMIEGQPNLSLLLAKNLKDGVVFNFGVFPIGEDKVQEFLQQFKTQVKLLWHTYLKSIDISMEITTSIVEREITD